MSKEPFWPLSHRIKFTWSHKIFDSQIKITRHIAKVDYTNHTLVGGVSVNNLCHQGGHHLLSVNRHSDFIHVFHKHIILSGLQSTIKMIHLIILAAVRKGYKRSVTCRILTCDNLEAGKTSCLQTWCNDAAAFPRKPTCTTQIRKHYYKLTVVNRAKVRR